MVEVGLLGGGGTHPGSGLPVIFESARISSTLLARDFGLALPQEGRPRAMRETAPATIPTLWGQL